MKRALQRLDPSRTGGQAATLEAGLRNRVVGQDHAIADIIQVYQTYLAGLSGNGRPVGSFLFLGPTGSGKTRLVEAVAETLVGDRLAVLKIDCGEFQHGHEIAKLVGSPPGYLGHRETHPLLSQETLDQRHTSDVKLSFVLFDEIEKASDTLWNLLLGILDKATLTLGDNRRVDFSRTMVFMTGNVGAAEMSSILQPAVGFTAGQERDHADPGTAARLSSASLVAARRRFTPEFLNRIDRITVFQPLGAAELRRILDLELKLVRERINQSQAAGRFTFRLNGTARDFLLREGADMRYGARHLRRAIERNLVHPLSNLIATGQVRTGDRVVIDYDPGSSRLLFFTEPSELSVAA